MTKDAASGARRIETAEHGLRTLTELRIEPLSEALPRWRNLLAMMPGATLYHREPWLRALERAYRLKLSVATLSAGRDIVAGCVFARSARPFGSRMVSLPFSDLCPPLCVDDEARELLLDELAEHPPAPRLEIRGVEGSARWQSAGCFNRWVLDLSRPAASVTREMSRTFRNNAKHAAACGVQVEKGSSREHVRRFYRLQLETRRRLGLPPQPLGFFTAVHDEFAAEGNVEIWFAVSAGRDIATLFILRDGAHLHCKWSARCTNGIEGATHLVKISLVEEYAGRASVLDLGRTDTRNEGLVGFKRHQGAKPLALPYAYFPKAPHNRSSEVMGPFGRAASRLWRHLPEPLTRVVGASLYRFFA
jgi:hypothetical protein